MILKVFKALWFLSMMAAVVNLLYVYASLPEDVIVQDQDTGRVFANREFLFYVVTALLLIVNTLVYATTRIFERNIDFRAWFHGLIVCINIFFIIALNLVQVFNSSERFDYSRIGFIIYGSVALVVLWAVSWPLYSVYRKVFAKPAV